MAFSSQGDRIALTQIEQMVDGQYHKLGYYDTQADNLTWFNNEQWVGGKVNKHNEIEAMAKEKKFHRKSGQQTFPSDETFLRFYVFLFMLKTNGRFTCYVTALTMGHRGIIMEKNGH